MYRRSPESFRRVEVSHLRVFLGLLVDLRQHVNGGDRRDVVLELQDRLAVPGDVHLIERVLQYVDLVLVREYVGGWFRATYIVLVGAVPVAQIARRKLSRGQRERVGRQLVHGRARLHRLRLVRLVGQPVDDLVVQNIEAHRRQRHPRHYVAGAEPDCHVFRAEQGVARVRTGHHVAEADGAQAHEAEIARV